MPPFTESRRTKPNKKTLLRRRRSMSCESLEKRHLLAASLGAGELEYGPHEYGPHASAYEHARDVVRTIVPGEVVVALATEEPISDFSLFFESLPLPESKSFGFGQTEELFALESQPTSDLLTLVKLDVQEQSDVLALASELEQLDEVAWAAPNYRYTGAILDFTPDDPQYSSQYHHTLIGNDSAWDTTLGNSDVIIAITDTGVDTDHEDLAANIWVNPGETPGNGIDDDNNGFIDDVNGWDFVGNDNDPNPNVIGDDHGTHVAGIAAAVTNNATGVAGTAGGATIMPIRISGSDGGFTSTIMANTFTYAIDNGARIANTSFNINGFVGDPTFTAGLQYYYDNGGLHFNSAGNGNELNPVRQSFHQTLLVANTTSADTRSGSSNYGTGVDVAAPGSLIRATLPNDNYGVKSGTSMAAPNAAGAAALIWSANPGWTRDQVAAQLLATADNIDAQNPGFEGLLGSGRINTTQLSDPIPAPQVSEVIGLPADGGTVSNLDNVDNFQLRFDQVMDPFAINNPLHFTLWDLGADGLIGGGDDTTVPITADSTYMIGTNEIGFTSDFGALEVGKYAMVVDADVTNPFGTPLDGDGNGSGPDPFETFFEVTAAPFEPVAPLGSLTYSTTRNGSIGDPFETDTYQFDVDNDQTITVILETDEAVTGQIELKSPTSSSLASAQASGAGADVVIQTVDTFTPGAGTYTVEVKSINGASGGYSLRVLLNAAAELEAHDGPTNDTPETAENINAVIRRPSGALQVSETAGTETFTVVLDAQPDEPVNVNVNSSDPSEVAVAQTQLQFNPDNWDQPQTVTVIGIDDLDHDGDQVTEITVSVADEVGNVDVDVADQSFLVTTIDNDPYYESTTLNTAFAGGNQPHDNRQPSLAMNYIVALIGIFPSESSPASQAEAAEPFIGEVKVFAGNFAPVGWAFARGQILNIANYQALFSILGTTYGGDGEQTFGLPDLRGRAAIGEGTGPGLTAKTLGQKIGVEEVTLTTAQMASHSHTIQNAYSGESTGNTGGGSAHTNLMPTQTLNYIIALTGIYPSPSTPGEVAESPESSDPFIGELTLFAGHFAPAGWAFADGQLLQIAQYSALFSLLGTTYGGDGEQTFGLPDLRGRLPIGVGNGPGLATRSWGEKGGAENVALNVSNLASHGHGFVPALGASTNNTGGNVPHQNMQPFLGMQYAISVVGTYPSQSAPESADPFIGEIMMTGFNYAPPGWVLANGQLLQIAQYSALFSLVGTTYGGDGEQTFGIPDLRGRTIVGVGSGPGLSEQSWGEKDGVENASLSVAQLPSHRHTVDSHTFMGSVVGSIDSKGSDGFESGTLGDQWTTNSSTANGRIQVTGSEGTAGGSFALLMDTSVNSTNNLNEAIWTVDLTGLTDATLNFSYAEWGDETHGMPADFTGSANGDGVAISDDGLNWHTILNAPDSATGVWQQASIDLAAAAATANMSLGPDFQIKFQQFDNFGLTTDGRGYDEISIEEIRRDEDWYEFFLDTGETATLSVKGQSSNEITVDLFDFTGAHRLASGVPAANLSSVINNFVNLSGSLTTYKARVSGETANEYQFVVTVNADFDTEANNDTTSAQPIGPANAAYGHVKSPEELPAAPALQDAERGGSTLINNWPADASDDVDVYAPREPSITLPYDPTESFEAVVPYPIEIPSENGPEASELAGPITVLSQFPGPPKGGFIPPDPTVAAGTDQIVAMTNTDIGIYDKVSGTELFFQSLNGSNGFFGSVGATTTVFDPWILYDHETDRFMAVAIDIESDTVSNVFLAISTDSTPTSGTDWHKYKIDFAHDATGTGLGDGVHFPDYEKMGVNSDAIFVSGNYFPINQGSGVYAGITAIEKAPLLSGGPVNVVYEEHFNGFSVFPMQQYGTTTTQYFAESLGGTTQRIHAIDDVLGGSPARQTFNLSVPAYNQPVNVPQLGGGTAADSISSRVMTGVLRDGSMWFAHAATDPAIGDGESVARWYEVATNDFAAGGSNPTLIQSGNIDPGPGVHAWMPAINVDASGNMGIGFALGGPNQFYSAGFTGRLADDPAGDTVLPVTEYATGLANYVATDGGGRNRWGDYTGLAVDPSDDATFWVFNEYASTGNDWATEIASFQLQSPTDDDWYQIAVVDGDQLVITTNTPGDGPLLIENLVDPQIELFDPNGALIAHTNVAGNESLIHTAGLTGIYNLRVFAAPGTEGEYQFEVLGATGTDPLPFAIDADPDDGALLGTFPTTYTLDFSESILSSSVQAFDLSIDGHPATDVRQIDGDTFEFTVDPAADSGDGTYTAVLAAISVQDLQGNINEVGFSSSFTVDTTGPRITSTTWNGDPFPASTTFQEGPLVFEAIFDEDLYQLGSARRGPFTPGTDDVVLFESTSGQTIAPLTVDYDTNLDKVTATFDVLPEGQYTLRLVSGDGAFEDAVGNDLDGEPIGPNLDGTITGNGVPGEDYIIDFSVDFDFKDAAPFERLQPLGGLMEASRPNNGLVNFGGDIDSFIIEARAGQIIAGSVTDLDEGPNSISIQLPALTGVFSGADEATLPPTIIPSDGLYEVFVSGSDPLNYSLSVFSGLQSELTAPGDDTGNGNELSLASSFIPLGDNGRYAVLGNADPTIVLPPTTTSLFGIQDTTDLIVEIDPVTGVVFNSFASPTLIDTVSGISGAEGGTTLIVQDSTDPSNVYRIDPATGSVLSTETMADTGSGARGGLSYEGTSIFAIDNGGPVDRQDGYGGPVVDHLSTVNPDFPGALGGDDNGRHFVAADGLIQEFDPAVPDTIINSFAIPAEVKSRDWHLTAQICTPPTPWATNCSRSIQTLVQF